MLYMIVEVAVILKDSSDLNSYNSLENLGDKNCLLISLQYLPFYRPQSYTESVVLRWMDMEKVITFSEDVFSTYYCTY